MKQKQFETLTVKGDVVCDSNQNRIEIGEYVILLNGNIKIHLRKTEKAGLHVAVLTRREGDFIYSLKLNRNGKYKVGQKYGHYVKPSRTEQIQEMLERKHLQNVDVVSISKKKSARFYLRGQNLEIVTDGRQIYEGVDVDWVKRGLVRHGTSYVSNGTFAFSRLGRKIKRLVIWPDCIPHKLETALEEVRAIV